MESQVISMWFHCGFEHFDVISMVNKSIYRPWKTVCDLLFIITLKVFDSNSLKVSQEVA